MVEMMSMARTRIVIESNTADKLFIGGKLERIARKNGFALIYGIVMAVLTVVGLLAVSPMQAHAAAASDQAVTQEKRGGEKPSYIVPTKPTVYLTFDDGPSKLTPKVLDILRSEGVPATFFVLGEQAKAHPELIKRIIKEGHALGNHSYNHEYKQLYSGYEQFIGQILATENILNDIAGIRPKLVRAPGGTYTNFDALYFANLKEAGYILFDWNIDSGDALRKNVPMKEIVAKVKKPALQHETIVLMHDGGGHEETVKALPEIIHYFKNRGYAFAAITPEVKPVQFPIAKHLKWNRGTSSADLAKNGGKKTEEDKSAAGQQLASGQQPAQQTGQQTAQQSGQQTAQQSGQQTAQHAIRQQPQQTTQQTAQSAAKEPIATQPKLHAGLQESTTEQHNTQTKGGQLIATKTDASASKNRANSVLTLQIGDDELSLQQHQFELRNGVVYVPLRALIEGMGGAVVWNESQQSALFRIDGYDGELSSPKQELQLSGGGQVPQTIGSFDYRWKSGSILVPLRQTVELIQHTVETYTMQAGKIEIRVA